MQHGDLIGWDQSNRAYILTHGVSGVDRAHYKHPLPEHVYEIYTRYWGDVSFLTEGKENDVRGRGHDSKTVL